MDELSLDVVGAVATITIHRPDKRNALTQQMWEDLAVLAGRIGDREGAQVMVVRSDVPGIFSAGADIGEYRRFAGDVAWGMASQARIGRALDAIRALRIPTIAVIDGGCVGGGSSIALACDFRLASTEAFFAITPARLGLLFPHEDVTALVDLVGAAAAKRILFTGSRFDSEWALRTGFVDELHPPDLLDGALARWVDQLTSVAPVSLRAMKQIIGLVQEGVRATTPQTRHLVEEALSSPDHREGVTAFLERRPARFTA